MNKLIEKIQAAAGEYASVPFWSWNDKLEPKELVRQIRDMHRLEMGGFFMHARGGLETEYLSEEWFDCVKVCVEEAERLGMEAWAYDENGWPSGFAGGVLLKEPDNHALYLKGEFTEEFPAAEENTVAIYALNEAGVPTRTEQAVSCTRYLHIHMGADDSYVDTMRGDITDRFIEATHREYQKRLGADFGAKQMPGFFTDEPQYYRWRTPYSKALPKAFEQENGYDIREALPALFCDYEGAKEHRYRFHRLTSRLFREGFAKRVYDWADANGVQITGHFIEEYSLAGQMLCCGDIMPLYSYEHIPGIDYLGRDLKRSDMGQKQLGSVCAQLGKKKALSEMFACCGWDVSPRELKRIAEFQYAGGVNVMCQHLYPYSIRGQRKRDYPAFYSEHSLWQEALLPFNRYFNRLGAALAMGEEYAETLVIHPIHSAWLTYQRVENDTSCKQLNDDFNALICLLCDRQLAYHLGDETMMAELATVEEGLLRVGKCRYKRVILPALDTLDSTTVALLKQFMAAGGKVYIDRNHLPTRIDGVEGDLSFLSDCEEWTAVLDRLCGEDDYTVLLPAECGGMAMRSMVRRTEGGRLIYMTNLSGKELNGVRVTLKNCSALGRLQLETLEAAPLYGWRKGEDAEVLLDLKADESVLLFEEEAPAFLAEAEQRSGRIRFDRPFALEELPDNMMPLDRAYLSLSGGEFSALRPLEQIRDNLLSMRFEGKVALSFPFYIEELPERLVLENEPFDGRLTVNGEEISLGDRTPRLDRSFSATDIRPYIQLGENRITLELDYRQREEVYHVLYGGVSESLRNCLVFDVELENLYLFGSFRLKTRKEAFETEDGVAFRYRGREPMALIGQKETVDSTNVVLDGYPFYCGPMTFSTVLDYRKGDPTLLRLTGRDATATVAVNGAEAASLVLTEYADLAPYLREGDNKINVTLCNNYRNLLGPHHMIKAEPTSVGPVSFSFEKKWDGDQCPSFEPDYSFVRFGIDV
ncbi:MAG: hypothetical protein IJP27_01290 [Clostridia bacterium]|nr:hypothetical protein [Clostridia bacterium]